MTHKGIYNLIDTLRNQYADNKCLYGIITNAGSITSQIGMVNYLNDELSFINTIKYDEEFDYIQDKLENIIFTIYTYTGEKNYNLMH